MLNDPFINDLDAGSQGESFEGSCASDEQGDEHSEEGGSVVDDGEDDEADFEPSATEKRFAGEVCFSPSTCPLLNLTACPAGDLVG